LGGRSFRGWGVRRCTRNCKARPGLSHHASQALRRHVVRLSSPRTSYSFARLFSASLRAASIFLLRLRLRSPASLNPRWANPVALQCWAALRRTASTSGHKAESSACKSFRAFSFRSSPRRFCSGPCAARGSACKRFSFLAGPWWGEWPDKLSIEPQRTRHAKLEHIPGLNHFRSWKPMQIQAKLELPCRGKHLASLCRAIHQKLKLFNASPSKGDPLRI